MQFSYSREREGKTLCITPLKKEKNMGSFNLCLQGHFIVVPPPSYNDLRKPIANVMDIVKNKVNIKMTLKKCWSSIYWVCAAERCLDELGAALRYRIVDLNPTACMDH